VVSVDDIEIRPRGVSEAIRIESARIEGPGPSFLLKAGSELSSKGVLPSYQPVDVSALPQSLGHQVRLSLSEGRVREGAMISIDEEQAVIERRSYGGSLSSKVRLAEVQSAGVLR
jgi:hypothetical protein